MELNFDDIKRRNPGCGSSLCPFGAVGQCTNGPCRCLEHWQHDTPKTIREKRGQLRKKILAVREEREFLISELEVFKRMAFDAENRNGLAVDKIKSALRDLKKTE